MYAILFHIGGTVCNLGKDPNDISSVRSSEKPKLEIVQD